MGKTTKKALLVALLSQKAPKDDSAFFFLASCICTNLILFGAAVQSTFLFRIGVGFFGFSSSKESILREGELEDWEMCVHCGEYFDGEDDEYCDDCGHDRF